MEPQDNNVTTSRDAYHLPGQQGFTLIELLVVVVAMGVVMVVFSNTMSAMMGAQNMANNERLRFENMQIARAMLDSAQQNMGVLPISSGTTVSGEKIPTNRVAFPDFTAAVEHRLLAMSRAAGTDDRERLYTVEEKTVSVPLSGISGETVQVKVQEGVVFSSFLEPGEGAEVDHSGLGINEISSNDALLPYRFSNRALQLGMLSTTNARLDRLMSAINNVVSLGRLSADPVVAITENFYPGGGTSLSGSGGTTDCGHGWIALNSDTAGGDIMNEIGLSQTEFGQTAWGEDIYYCYDYQPAGSTASPPYFGALFFNSTMNNGTGNKVYLTP